MFKNSDDTIAAIATATGAGGVGIIRLSGPEAGKILAFVCKRDIEKISDRYFYYGKVWSGDELLDEVLFVLMKGPRSFTGEDVAEIHAHGGSANLGRILRATMEAGARHAEAGEFSRRAFQNGRIDLTRAEAIVDIVNASSERALRVAQSQLAGQLGDEVSDIIENLTMLLAELEADIDFPEDEVPEQERARQMNTAQSLSQRCSKLGQSYGLGKRLQGGVDVVLRGEVNAGKSSLFNALVGEERAIVGAEAGTTRDFVEAQIVFYPLLL